MRCNIGLIVLMALMTVVSAAAHAQTGVHLNFTGATLSAPNEPNVYGSTFGIYSQTTRFGMLRVGADGRGFILSGDGGKETFLGGAIGPRVAIKPHGVPLSPYAEVLFGVAHAEFGQGSARKIHTGPMYQAIVGLDLTIVSHLDWRVVEYTYGQQQGTGLGYKALSTGIVIRFP
jgi:hypothetical protein